MATARQYRQRAEVCLELAQEAKDPRTKEAMMELAEEFNRAAEKLQRASVDAAPITQAERPFEGYMLRK